MKQLKGVDYILIAVLAAMVAGLIIVPGKGHGKHVPVDPRHLPIYDAVEAGRSQAETELVCLTCHGKSTNPLPQNHPPKEQCLICHLLA